MKMKRITIALLCAIMGFHTYGQKTFSEVDSETYAKKGTIAKRKNDASGQAFSDLTGKKLEKVALISFVSMMPPDQDKYGSMTVTTGLSGNAIKQFANELYDNSIKEMKSAFQAHGAELISYEEMSDEQKEILNNLQSSKWMTRATQDERIRTTYVSEYQTIYKKVVWDIGSPAYDYKSLKSVVLLPSDLNFLGILCQSLGVDAVLIVNNKFDLEKGAAYDEFSMNLIGINPVSFDQAMAQAKSNMHKKLIAKNYWDGVVYTESTFAFKSPVMVSERKKGDYSTPDYTGYGSFVYSAIDASLAAFEERTK